MSKRGVRRAQTKPRRLSRLAPRQDLLRITDRIRGLIKGSRLSTEAVLEAYETSLVDAGLGD